jgi:hypothetical protein
VEWLGTSVWTQRSVVAERYSNGQVFLAGDAVHQLSPTGALGMNTGIGRCGRWRADQVPANPIAIIDKVRGASSSHGASDG